MWPWERSIDSPNDEPGASILYLLPIFWAPADLQGFFRRPRATSCFRMSQHRLISAYLLAKRTKWPSHCAKHTVAIRLQVSLGAKSKMAAPCARSVLVRDRKKGEFCRHIRDIRHIRDCFRTNSRTLVVIRSLSCVLTVDILPPFCSVILGELESFGNYKGGFCLISFPKILADLFSGPQMAFLYQSENARPSIFHITKV